MVKMSEGLERSIPEQISLRPDEKITIILKRRYPSIISSLFAGFAFFIWIIGSNVVRFISRYITLPEEAWVITGLYIIVVVGGGILAIVLLIGYFYVKGHLYVVTNKRILVLRKFIGITVREVAHREVTDIVVNQGPLARLLNYGSVSPMSPGVRTPYTLPYPFMRRGFVGPRVSLKDVSDPCKVASNLYGLIQSVG
jgi:hypothetical protein